MKNYITKLQQDYKYILEFNMVQFFNFLFKFSYDKKAHSDIFNKCLIKYILHS